MSGTILPICFQTGLLKKKKLFLLANMAVVVLRFCSVISKPDGPLAVLPTRSARAALSQKTKLYPPARFLCDSLNVPHVLLWQVRGRQLAPFTVFSAAWGKKGQRQYVACKPLDNSITGQPGGRDCRVYAYLCRSSGSFPVLFFFPLLPSTL